MSTPIRIPGGRDVAGSVDSPDAESVVVACPPHPQHGGRRTDQRLRAVSDALAPEIACLRFDYGPWDEGRGEQVDARNALDWASERYDAVGLFGYSFGAAVALCACADRDPETSGVPAALSVLAPPAGLTTDHDAADALDDIACPVQVVYGERDDTVNWRPVVERAREQGHTVDSIPADHHFVGQTARVGELIAGFVKPPLTQS